MHKNSEAAQEALSEQAMLSVEPAADLFLSGCHRCGGASSRGKIMSRLCVQMICSTCEEEERGLPEYKQVMDAENEHLLRCIRSNHGDEPTSLEQPLEPLSYEYNMWPAPGGSHNPHNRYTDTNVGYVVGWYVQHRGGWGENTAHFWHESSGQRVCISVVSGVMKINNAPMSSHRALQAAALRCGLQIQFE